MVGCLLGSGTAAAVPNDTDGDTVNQGRCTPGPFVLGGRLVSVGMPLANSTIQLNAENAKLVAIPLQDKCDEIYARITSFRWRVVGTPRGETATLTGARTYSPGLRLGGPGRYRVRLTACPSRCVITVARAGRVTVEPTSQEITINAVESIVLPPETEPIRPPLEATEPTEFAQDSPTNEEKCLFGGGVVDPQWVTVEPFDGPEDYRLVEGRIDKSRISSQDNFLNHHSQDHIFAINPDPPYRNLLSRKPEFTNRQLLGLEWEVDRLPARYRPTAGDRASVFGFWIFDCAHAFYTEIHPPVGVAIERPRPVRIPSSFQPEGYPNGMGTNVIVPGITTDIWFNRRSGEITSNCSDTGLAQPAVVPFIDEGDCIREPHSLEREFRFRIYLPRNPETRMEQETGIAVPPIPLYAAARPPAAGSGASGPEPTIRIVTQDGITYLDVTIDLRGFAGETYARRIDAAWAYPARDNWDVRRWRVTLEDMDVENDAEPPGDDGDWRVFFNTNNRVQEWTKIMDCNGCVDDNETIDLDLRTGAELGDDPVVFPDQSVMVHTTGYDDEVWGDGTGEVLRQIPDNLARSVCRRSSCRYSDDSLGGGGAYTLNYTVRPASSLGRAALTPAARALYDAYTIRGEARCTELRPQLCVVLPERNAALFQDWDPRNLALTTRTASGRDFPLFEAQETEHHAITGITTRGLRRVMARLRARDPVKYKRILAEFRAEIGAMPSGQRRDLFPLVDALRRSLARTDFVRALPRGFRPSRIRRFPVTEPRREAEAERR